MKKTIGLICFALLALPTIGCSQKKPMTGEQVYHKTCFVCHAKGVAGAPKFGDKQDWAPRIAAGMDNLYKVALHGEGAMPPKGGNSTLTDAEVKAAVDYMVSKVKK